MKTSPFLWLLRKNIKRVPAIAVMVLARIGHALCMVLFALGSQGVIDSAVSGGNSNLFLSTLGWMCDYEQSMSIHAKPLQTDALVVPAAKANLWSAVAVIGMPLFVLCAGAIIVLDRRKK